MNRTATPPSFGQAVARRIAPLLAVLALWVVGCAVNLTWLRRDHTPPSWDPSVHLSYSLSYYAYLTRLPFGDAWAGLGLTSLYYPPLVHTVGAVCYVLFGVIQPAVAGLETADVPVLGNFLFMGLLLFSTYALAARWYGTRAGLMAALLVACYPIFAAQSRLCLLDYPLAALTVTVMALLVASEGLTHPFWVWPLGVAAGAALWCKWSFLFLFFPPLALSLSDGLRRLRVRAQPELTPVRLGFNLAVVVAGMLLLAGPWYLSHPLATVQELRVSNQTWVIDSDPAVLSAGGLLYYFRALFESQLFLPFTLLAGFGLLYALAHRGDADGLTFLLVWLVGGWAVFTLVPNKDPRFTMPLLPALAVLSVSWLYTPSERSPTAGWQRVRGWLSAATVALALAQYQGVAYGLPPLPERLGPRLAPLWSTAPQMAAPPAGRTWPHDELVREIARSTPLGGRIGVLPNTGRVNYLTIRYYVLRQFLPYLIEPDHVPEVRPAVRLAGGRQEPATVASLREDGFDCLVLLEGEQGPHATAIDQTVANLRAEWDQFLDAFEPVAALATPDGRALTLYRRRSEPGLPDAVR